MIPTETFLHRHWHGLLVAVLSVVVIMLMECFLFNLPFWTSLPASTDTDSASNTMGSGLELTGKGLLKVTDPTNAYLEVKADGSSSFARVDVVSKRAKTGSADSRPLSSIHVRLDGDGKAGQSTSIHVNTPRSLYLRCDARSSLRLMIQEPTGSLIPISALRANVRIPFQFDLLRMGLMAGTAMLLAFWRPGSALWRITLDSGSIRQRLLFWSLMAILGLATVWGVAGELQNPRPLIFHHPGNYTYDFDQYGHMANSLLHGHFWLDLPVPKALAQATDPYSSSLREKLLSQGTSPIYWDYAFYHGRWYSYFGVLPALVLFLPYQLMSSLWVPGGSMLPSGPAVALLTFGFVLFGSLLVVRLIGRLSRKASLATVSMALSLFFVGSNIVYLVFRSNFYSVPFASSLLLSVMGLWLWLGASDGRHKIRVWSGPGVPSLSLPHLSGGALCLAANVGCRPTFAIVSLLAFPLFWSQIKALCTQAFHQRTGLLKALHAPLAVLIPATVIVAPLAWYNAARFGSPFNFGNSYQLTVTDMTAYRPSLRNLLPTIGYYLFLPLRAVSEFPYLSISPTPLPRWSYTEPLVGGLVVLCPLLILAFGLPGARRSMKRSRLWPTLMLAFLLGLALTAIDSLKGGLGWRYMSDFGWLFSLAAIGTMVVFLRESGRTEPPLDELQTVEFTVQKAAHGIGWSMRLRRLLVLLLLMASLALLLLPMFIPGRNDALTQTDPGLFYTVRSWFL